MTTCCFTLFTVLVAFLLIISLADVALASSEFSLDYIKRAVDPSKDSTTACAECPTGDCRPLKNKGTPPPIPFKNPRKSKDDAQRTEFDAAGTVHITLAQGTKELHTDVNRLRLHVWSTESKGCYVIGLKKQGAQEKDEKYAIVDIPKVKGECNKVFDLKQSDTIEARAWKLDDKICD